jgi:hypothetical protein
MSEAGRSESPFFSDTELASDDSPKIKSKGKKKSAGNTSIFKLLSPG